MAPASPLSHEACPNNLQVSHINAKSSPLARSHKVKRTPIPTATTHRAYRIVDTEESLIEYTNKDGEKDWPTKPQLLRKRTTLTYFMLCWDVLVTLLPVVFLGRFAVHVVFGLVTFHSCPLSPHDIFKAADEYYVLFSLKGVCCSSKKKVK